MGITALGLGNDPRISKSSHHCGFGSPHWKCFCRSDSVNLIHGLIHKPIQKVLCSGALSMLVLALVLVPAVLSTSVVAVVSASSPKTEVVCEFTDPRLTEISGMAPSAMHQGVMWVHNDSGDDAKLYALTLDDCSIVGELSLRGVSARDFEGLAAGVDPKGRSVLWVGDIGDNRDSWSDVSIYRVREPKKLGKTSAQVKRYRFTYEDRPHNAETILADPNSQQIWIVTKQLASGSIYALPKKLKESGVNIAKRIGPATGLITDGAMNADGTGFVLRDYFDAQFFDGRPAGELAQEVELPAQPQGEAIAWLPGENAVVIASEGDNRLLRVPAPAPAPAPTSATAQGELVNQGRTVNTGQSVNYVVLIGVVSGVVILVTGLIKIRKRPESKTTGSTKKAE
jgi:hypothetical protein